MDGGGVSVVDTRLWGSEYAKSKEQHPVDSGYRGGWKVPARPVRHCDCGSRFSVVIFPPPNVECKICVYRSVKTAPFIKPALLYSERRDRPCSGVQQGNLSSPGLTLEVALSL